MRGESWRPWLGDRWPPRVRGSRAAIADPDGEDQHRPQAEEPPQSGGLHRSAAGGQVAGAEKPAKSGSLAAPGQPGPSSSQEAEGPRAADRGYLLSQPRPRTSGGRLAALGQATIRTVLGARRASREATEATEATEPKGRVGPRQSEDAPVTRPRGSATVPHPVTVTDSVPGAAAGDGAEEETEQESPGAAGGGTGAGPGTAPAGPRPEAAPPVEEPGCTLLDASGEKGTPSPPAPFNSPAAHPGASLTSCEGTDQAPGATGLAAAAKAGSPPAAYAAELLKSTGEQRSPPEARTTGEEKLARRPSGVSGRSSDFPGTPEAGPSPAGFPGTATIKADTERKSRPKTSPSGVLPGGGQDWPGDSGLSTPMMVSSSSGGREETGVRKEYKTLPKVPLTKSATAAGSGMWNPRGEGLAWERGSEGLPRRCTAAVVGESKAQGPAAREKLVVGTRKARSSVPLLRSDFPSYSLRSWTQRGGGPTGCKRGSQRDAAPSTRLKSELDAAKGAGRSLESRGHAGKEQLEGLRVGPDNGRPGMWPGPPMPRAGSAPVDCARPQLSSFSAPTVEEKDESARVNLQSIKVNLRSRDEAQGSPTRPGLPGSPGFATAVQDPTRKPGGHELLGLGEPRGSTARPTPWRARAVPEEPNSAALNPAAPLEADGPHAAAGTSWTLREEIHSAVPTIRAASSARCLRAQMYPWFLNGTPEAFGRAQGSGHVPGSKKAISPPGSAPPLHQNALRIEPMGSHGVTVPRTSRTSPVAKSSPDVTHADHLARQGRQGPQQQPSTTTGEQPVCVELHSTVHSGSSGKDRPVEHGKASSMVPAPEYQVELGEEEDFIEPTPELSTVPVAMDDEEEYVPEGLEVAKEWSGPWEWSGPLTQCGAHSSAEHPPLATPHLGLEPGNKRGSSPLLSPRLGAAAPSPGMSPATSLAWEARSHSASSASAKSAPREDAYDWPEADC